MTFMILDKYTNHGFKVRSFQLDPFWFYLVQNEDKLDIEKEAFKSATNQIFRIHSENVSICVW
jgi:hypothetical protein